MRRLFSMLVVPSRHCAPGNSWSAGGECRGMGVGAAIAIGRLGSIGGPKLGGWLKGLGHSSSQLLLDLLPIAIIGSVFAAILALRKR